MPETKETKKTTAKTEVKAEAKKPAVKKTAPKKTAAKKTAVKKTVAKKPAKKAISLDTLTTAIWKKLEKKDVSKINTSIAIQVNAAGAGTFYIAVNADETYKKQVIQADYYLADGIVEASAEEIKKIAAGNYSYIDAVKSGALIYRGDLAKAVIIAELLK